MALRDNPYLLGKRVPSLYLFYSMKMEAIIDTFVVVYHKGSSISEHLKCQASRSEIQKSYSIYALLVQK